MVHLATDCFSQGGFDFNLVHPWTQFAFFSLIVLFIGHII